MITNPIDYTDPLNLQLFMLIYHFITVNTYTLFNMSLDWEIKFIVICHFVIVIVIYTLIQDGVMLSKLNKTVKCI